MRKSIAYLLSAAVCVTMFAGCGKKAAPDQTTAAPTGTTTAADNKKAGKKLNVVASFYPLYDFAKKIGGDYVTVKNMVPAGTEPHDWEPAASDIAGLEEANVFVYNGAGMEHWVDKVLKTLKNKNLITVEASKGVELLKGHHHHHHGEDHDHDHDHDKKDEHGHDHDHDSFTKADVENRDLSQFDGAWQSIRPYVEDGTLDAWVKASAEKKEKNVSDMKADLLKKFSTEYPNLTIKGNEVSVQKDGKTVATGKYKSAGFLFKEGEHHPHVWYQYEIESPVNGLPKYIMINDHGYKVVKEKPDAHEAHIHLLCSNEGFEQALATGTSPFYVSATLKKDDVQKMFAPKDDHDHDHDHDHHDEEGTDPHIWLNPNNVKIEAKNIADAFIKADPDHKAEYEKNLKAFTDKLTALDKEFKDTLSALPNKTIVTSHEAFGYLAKAYGLTQLGIEGINPDSEPDAARMAKVIDFVKEHKVKVIFFEELVSPKVAEAIAKETGAKTDVLNPLEGLSDSDMKKGMDYFSVMRQNLAALKNALQ